MNVDTPVAGAANAVAELRAAGKRVVFITNNSAPTVAENVAKLQSFGIPATEADVLTSANGHAKRVEIDPTLKSFRESVTI